MNLGTAYAAGTSIAGVGTPDDPVCNNDGCWYCDDDDNCSFCPAATEEEPYPECRSLCGSGYYGNGTECSLCSDTYPNYPSSMPNFNSFASQCFKLCNTSCNEYNDWVSYFGANAVNFTYERFYPKEAKQLEFQMLSGQNCNMGTNYCTYEISCTNAAIEACKPGHVAVTFKDADGNTLNTYYTVNRTVWSTQNTQAGITGLYSGVVYPIFVTPTAPTIAGHKFIGWYDAQTGGTQRIAPTFDGAMYGDLTFDLASTYVGGIARTLYAQYESTCDTTILLDANGGSFTGTCAGEFQPTQSGGQWLSPTLGAGCMPTLDGYTFMGYVWTDGGGGMYYDANLNPVSPEWTLCDQNKVILQASWEGNCNLITFNDNNVTGTNVNANNTQRKRTRETDWLNADGTNPNLCGKPMTTNPTVAIPTNPNAVFQGYYTTRDTDGYQIFDASGATTSYGNTQWRISISTTLYARWECNSGYEWNATTHACEPNTFSVKYMCGVGTGADTTNTATYGTDYTVLNLGQTNCAYTGHTFLGWVFSGDSNTYNGGETFNWTYANDNQTFTAQWSGVNTYNIYYENMANATPSATGMPTTYSYGTGATINGVPTRPLSEFLGWCTDAELTDCAETQTIGTDETGNKTFWANWECVSPYHPDPSNPSVCVTCENNTWWNPDTELCESCPQMFPYSRAPYTWSEKQCYRLCVDGTQCESDIGDMLSGIPSSCSVEQFLPGITTQIEFKGNYDDGIQTCGGTVPNCPYGFIQCGIGDAYKPMVAPVEFHGKIPEQNLGTRYIFGSRAGGFSIDLIRGDAWTQIAGSGQKTNVIHNNVGGVMVDYQYTHILYPTNAAPNAEVTGYTFDGYYYPRSNGARYVESDYLLNATNALSVLQSQSGDSNTARHLYATMENGGYTQDDYTITYNCGTATGGTTPAQQTGIHYGDSVTPQANTCTKPGYTFQGWMVSNTTDIKRPGTAFTWQYEENKVFTAKWSDDPNTYVITYTPGYVGSGQSDFTQNITFGVQFQTQGRIFTRDGYIMTGWSDPFPLLSHGYTYNVEDSTTLDAQWQICPNGTQPNEAGTACEPCPDGQYGVNGTCEPCPDGTQPDETGTACEPCPEGEAGLGGICNPCPAGTQPNATHTECVPCPAGQYSVNGICMPCPTGQIPNANGDGCEPCPDGQYPVNGVCAPCPAGTYGTGGICEPCPDGYSSNPGATSIEQCFITECPTGQHLDHGTCHDNVIECTAPHASFATRTWNPSMFAYGTCIIQECIDGYHIASNACVLDEQFCAVPNGRGERMWDGTQWGACEVTQCDPGFENTGTACRECDNRRVDGEIAVSSYASGCEIATCMYHGQKYILENNECRAICENHDDETGSMRWDNVGKKCIRTCNPGYKMW